MHIFLIALLVIAILGFVVATIKPSTNKKTGRPYKRSDMAIGGGIIIVILAVLTGLSVPKAKTAAVAKPAAKAAPVKAATTAPKPSLATLNAEVVPILTPVLSDFSQQMAQGEADATQSNAGTVSSAFHAWEENEQDKQNVANGQEEHNAYLKADKIYYAAHRSDPDALSNWDGDAGAVPGDITEWANAEELVAQDGVTGSSSLSTDQQAATTDMQTYQSDLAKAKADIAGL